MRVNPFLRLVFLIGVIIICTVGGTALVSGQEPDHSQAGGVGAQSTTKTLSAVADAYIGSLDPNSNHGTLGSLVLMHDPYLPVGDDVTYGLIRFNLAANVPAGATIEWARLRVYLDGIGNTTEPLPVRLGAHRITGPWSETGVTWYSQPSVGPSEAAASISHPVATWKTWSVTNMVRTWHANPAQNYGVELRGPALSMYYLFFNSREQGPGPYLDVTYHVAAPTPTATRTPTPRPTATPTPTVEAECRNLLSNGDFESGQLWPWSTDGSVWLGGGRQSAYGAYLGGQVGQQAELFRQVFIPQALGASTLRFWWRAEATQTQLENHLVVWVEQGSYFENVFVQPATGPLNKWQHAEVELPASVKGDVALGFLAGNYTSIPATFRLDGIELLGCGHFLNLPLICR